MTNSSDHLGERLSALVDGELGHEERDRALAHVTHCVECRAEMDGLRQVKARLSRFDGPYPSAELGARLAAVPATENAAVPAGATTASVTRPKPRRDPQRNSRRDSRHPGGRPTRDPQRRRRLAAGASGGLVVAALIAAFALGGGPTGGQPVTPEVDRFAVEHAAVTDEVPLTDTGGSAVTVSFLPTGLP